MRAVALFILTTAAATLHAEPYLLQVRSQLSGALVDAVRAARQSESATLSALDPVIQNVFELERRTAAIDANQRDAVIRDVVDGAWADAKRLEPGLGDWFDPGRARVRRALRVEKQLGPSTWANQRFKAEASRQLRLSAVLAGSVVVGSLGASLLIHHLELGYPWTMTPLAGSALITIYPLTLLPGLWTSERRRKRLTSIIERCQRALR